MILAPRTIKTISDLFNASRNGLKVMVQRLGCSYTEKLLQLLGAHGCRPDRIMEIGTLEGIVGLVEAGVGVATMPESFVRPLLRGRKLASCRCQRKWARSKHMSFRRLEQRVITAGERVC